MQPREVSIEQAIHDAPGACARLAQLAAAHREQHKGVNTHDTVRHWEPTAGTFCYQTHIAIDRRYGFIRKGTVTSAAALALGRVAAARLHLQVDGRRL